MAIMFCLSSITPAQEKGPRAEGMTERKKLNEDEVGRLDTGPLFALYEQILDHQYQWAGNELEKVGRRIMLSKDPQMDAQLISFFQRVLEEDGKHGNLNSFHVKLPRTKSEYVLGLIAQRVRQHKTPRLVEFVLSLTTNKHAVIRSVIAGVLGPDILTDPQNEELLAKVAPLLGDKNPNVSFFTMQVFTRWFAENKRMLSPSLARAFVAAYEKTEPGVKTAYSPAYGGGELKTRLDEAIQAYDAHLEKHRASASPQERDQIDSVIQIIKQSQWGKEKHD